MKLTKGFKFSPDGVKTIEYKEGDDVEGRALEIAKSMGIVGKKPSQNKAKKPSLNK